MALIDDIISYWKCDDDAANTTITDEEGINDGIFVGGNTEDKTATGIINSAFDLDGADDYLNLASAFTDFNINARSASFWFNADDITPASLQALIAYDGTACTYGQFTARLNTDGTIVFIQGGTNITTSALSAGWNHIVLTQDATNYKIYVNNSLEGTGNTGTSESGDVTSVFYVGTGRVLSIDYAGLFDEIGIWAKTLTTDEISELYNSGSGLAYPFASTFIPKITIF